MTWSPGCIAEIDTTLQMNYTLVKIKLATTKIKKTQRQPTNLLLKGEQAHAPQCCMGFRFEKVRKGPNFGQMLEFLLHLKTPAKIVFHHMIITRK